MPSSKVIITRDVQKEMAKFGLGCKFHDLEYFKFSYSLNSF